MTSGKTKSSRSAQVRLFSIGCTHGQPDSRTGNRIWVRWQAEAPLEICRETDGPYGAWAGQMSNVSPAGIAFRSSEALKPGDLIRLRATDPRDAGPWVEARVIHCCESDSGFLVGAEFIGPDTE